MMKIQSYQKVVPYTPPRLPENRPVRQPESEPSTGPKKTNEQRPIRPAEKIVNPLAPLFQGTVGPLNATGSGTQSEETPPTIGRFVDVVA